MRLVILTLLTCLTAIGQEFIPFLGGGSANGLKHNLSWYVEADSSSGVDEPPETPNFGICCAGNVFVQFNANWGSSSGVITNSRVAPGNGSLTLNYDYYGGTDFTVAGWVKFSSLASTQVLVASWQTDVPLAREYRLRYKTAANSFELEAEQTAAAGSAAVSIVPSPAITTGTWFFVAAGFIDSSNTLFITAAEDGGTLPAVTTAALGAQIQNNPLAVNIGAQSSAGNPDIVDEVMLANTEVDAWGFWIEVLNTAKLDFLYAKTPYGLFSF